MLILKHKLAVRNFAHITFLFVAVCFFSHCARKEPLTKNAAEKTVIEALRNEAKVNAVVHTEGNTLYTYIPTIEKIYEVKQIPASTPISGPVLSFTGVLYNNSNFTIEYTYETFKSETTSRKYHEGYGPELTPDASKLVRTALYALTRALTVSSERINFFVLIVADVKEGIEIRYTIHERDLKKWLSLGQAFELGKSIIIESYGSLSILNDKSGKHIKYKDIAMADFLCDRIYLALLRDLDQEFTKKHPKIPWSDRNFPDIASTILKISNEIISSYDFLGFKEVIIRDVYNHKEKTTKFSELMEMFPR